MYGVQTNCVLVNFILHDWGCSWGKENVVFRRWYSVSLGLLSANFYVEWKWMCNPGINDWWNAVEEHNNEIFTSKSTLKLHKVCNLSFRRFSRSDNYLLDRIFLRIQITKIKLIVNFRKCVDQVDKNTNASLNKEYLHVLLLLKE